MTQSTPSQPILLRSILILPFRLSLGIPNLSLPLMSDAHNQVQVSFTHVACNLNIPDFKGTRRGIQRATALSVYYS